MPIGRPMQVRVELLQPEEAVAVLDSASSMACRQLPLDANDTVPQLISCMDHALVSSSMD